MFPRNVSSAWEIFAPAKLNLYLEVLGPRADGFHALETLMVPVRIYDQLVWHEGPARGDALALRVRNLLAERSSADALLADNNKNLVLRAAHLLAKTAGIAPHGRFDLIKRIPLQAGLGGGSSDAAATLLLANQAWKIGYSHRQLMPLAAQLGSDVPFFLRSHRAAICRGRGELIEPVARLPRLHFVVVKPNVGLSTAEVFGQVPSRNSEDARYAKVSNARLSELISALRTGAIATAARQMTNRLEAAAMNLAPWLVELREAFVRAGCLGQFMTGSGSAYVGVMHSSTQARQTVRRLAAQNLGNVNLGSVFATSSC